MSRKLAREKAFECLFGQNFANPKQTEGLWEFTLQESESNLTDEDKMFATELCKGVLTNIDEIKEVLSKVLKGYNFDALYQADKTILMIAVYEILYTDLDKKIVVNEAVEISKKFGIEKSFKFVNGVLSGVLKLNEWKHD